MMCARINGCPQQVNLAGHAQLPLRPYRELFSVINHFSRLEGLATWQQVRRGLSMLGGWGQG